MVVARRTTHLPLISHGRNCNQAWQQQGKRILRRIEGENSRLLSEKMAGRSSKKPATIRRRSIFLELGPRGARAGALCDTALACDYGRGVMRDMVFLQLERRGLASARTAQEAVFDYRVIKTIENRTLVLAVSLPPNLPANLSLDLLNFEPSARTYLLPRDEILWREGDRLAVAVTQGSDLVYFQALGDGSLTEAVILELQCVRLQLEAEHVVERLTGITLWDEFSRDEVAMLEEAMDLRSPCSPSLPDCPRSEARPPPAGRARNAEVAQSVGAKSLARHHCRPRLFHARAPAGASRGVAIHQCRRVESDLAAMRRKSPKSKRPQVEWTRWKKRLIPKLTPPNCFSAARDCCPRTAPFHFVRNENRQGEIEGEAKNAPTAFKFGEDLRKFKDLGDFQWQMQAPTLLANDNAKFSIDGIRYGAKDN